MTTIRELNEHIMAGTLPLHVAIELESGELAAQWFNENYREHEPSVELLLLTRPLEFIVWLEALPQLLNLGPDTGGYLFAEAISARWSLSNHLIGLSGAIRWLRQIGKSAGARGVPKQRIYDAVRGFGPPTLEEIVAAAEARKVPQ